MLRGMTPQPNPTTTDKYGLSFEEWLANGTAQGCACGVCRQVKRLVIDHKHVVGWAKMPPEERKRYVRGLLCVGCNWKMVPRGMTLAKAEGLVEYLKDFERRFNGSGSGS
jgi:hypothetical protein